MNTYRIEVIDTDGDVVLTDIVDANAPEEALTIAAETPTQRQEL